MEFGCLARYFNDYRDEVKFAKKNGFDFLQIWYDSKGLNQKKVEELLPVILDEGFPAIIHAVLDVNEIPEHITILKDMLLKLGFMDATEIHEQVQADLMCERTEDLTSSYARTTREMSRIIEENTVIAIALEKQIKC